jgi:hypothetical protein
MDGVDVRPPGGVAGRVELCHISHVNQNARWNLGTSSARGVNLDLRFAIACT